jgi:hypothetical protein
MRAPARRAEVSSAPEKRNHPKPETGAPNPSSFRIDIPHQPYSHRLASRISAFTKNLRFKTHRP